jgi:hypothetical protein
VAVEADFLVVFRMAQNDRKHFSIFRLVSNLTPLYFWKELKLTSLGDFTKASY